MSGRRSVVGLACAVQFIDVVGVTLLVVALPDIQRDLDLGPAALSWVAAIYALAFGGLLVLGGRAADLLGHRLMFIAGNTVVLAGSLLCATAGTTAVLLTGRALQGIGAAVSVPAALAAILAVIPAGPPRNRALGLWTMAGAVGGASGFVLGGVVTQAIGWRWLFAAVAVIALLAAAIAPAILPPNRRPSTRQPLDLSGALLITGAAVLLMVGLQRAETDGFTAPSSWLPLVLTPLAALAFAARERRAPAPLVPPHLWSVPTFRVGAATAFVLTATTSGASVIGTLFLQDELNLSPASSGAAFLLLSASVAATSTTAPSLIRRRGTAPTLTIGLAVVAAAMLTQAVAVALHHLPLFLTGLALTGAGLGLASVASTTHGTTGADDSTSGVIGGLLNAAAQVGTAVGIATLLTTATTWPIPTQAPEAAFSLAALTALTAALTTLLTTRHRTPTTHTPTRTP
ncbi:MFS transporter [Actinoplanes sp. NPDC024001]|uniref:MFS transporter n=1 Tax=Actinoplanes sp. NPDC024001 TaxID=3154598 RepID=UPI00340995B2